MSEFENEQFENIKEFVKVNKSNINVSDAAKARIIKNCNLKEYQNVNDILNDVFDSDFSVEKKGKNYYIKNNNYILTINASTLNLITAHINKDNIETIGKDLEKVKKKNGVKETNINKDIDQLDIDFLLNEDSIYGEIISSDYFEDNKYPAIILQIEDKIGEDLDNMIGALVCVDEDESMFILDKENKLIYDLTEKDVSDLKDFGFIKSFKEESFITEDSVFLDSPCNKFYIPKNINEVANAGGTFYNIKNKLKDVLTKLNNTKNNGIASVMSIFI